MSNPRVLVIDDQWGAAGDPMIPDTYGRLPFTFLLESAAEDDATHSVAAAMNRIGREAPRLCAVLLDIMFGPNSEPLGIDMLKAIRSEYPVLPVLMLTSLGSDENRETVVRCMELGANEYIVKAPDAARLKTVLDLYVDPTSDMALYGNGLCMRALRAQIARVAFSGETSVLIAGESGTGKELIARAIHRQGPKKFGRFVAKNCAHSDLQLLDSELFGHERGAFTGATEQRIGLIEEADKGVLFLDEISDMPAELQAKLLRVLETRSFRRLGGEKDLKSDFQLICATNREPEQLLRDGVLRQDFYYRICTMTLRAPPLREHKEDIPAYAGLFLRKLRARGFASYPGGAFSKAALDRLTRFDWPGNVRELRNVVEHAVIESRNRTIGVECLPGTFADDRGTEPTHRTRQDGLPDDPATWLQERLLVELRFAVEAKRRIQTDKGPHWKAEFMRRMYRYSRTQTAKGVDDLIRRLTQPPLGDPHLRENVEARRLLEELED